MTLYLTAVITLRFIETNCLGSPSIVEITETSGKDTGYLGLEYKI